MKSFVKLSATINLSGRPNLKDLRRELAKLAKVAKPDARVRLIEHVNEKNYVADTDVRADWTAWV